MTEKKQDFVFKMKSYALSDETDLNKFLNDRKFTPQFGI